MGQFLVCCDCNLFLSRLNDKMHLTGWKMTLWLEGPLIHGNGLSFWTPRRVLCCTPLAWLPSPLGCQQESQFSRRLLRAAEHPLVTSHLEAGPLSSLPLSTGIDMNALGQKGPSKEHPLPLVCLMSSHSAFKTHPRCLLMGWETVMADKCDGLSNPWKHLESCILRCNPILQVRTLGH